MAERLIDAHQHFWDLRLGAYSWMAGEAMEPVRRNFLPQDLKPLLDASGIHACITVQCRHDLEETRWMLALAEQYSWIAGIVGWAHLASLDCSAEIAALKRLPGSRKLIALRHQAHDEADADWLAREEVARGVSAAAKAGLAFDLLTRTRELTAAARLVKHVPEARFILDHLSKPQIAAGVDAAWFDGIAEIAEQPNVFCKLSGLITEAHWKRWRAEDFSEAFAHAQNCFGPERLIFGSDWPVCLLSGGYSEVKKLAETLTAGFSAEQRAGVFGGNAARVYRLDALAD